MGRAAVRVSIVRRAMVWVVAFIAGSFAGVGVSTLVKTGSTLAWVSGVLGSLLVAAFVMACVVTAMASVFPSLRGHAALGADRRCPGGTIDPERYRQSL
jgi:hypothetical protein